MYSEEEKKNAILVINYQMCGNELAYSSDCRGCIAYCSEEYYNKAVAYWRSKKPKESENTNNEKQFNQVQVI